MALRVAGWSLLLWLLVLDAVATNADSIAEPPFVPDDSARLTHAIVLRVI